MRPFTHFLIFLTFLAFVFAGGCASPGGESDSSTGDTSSGGNTGGGSLATALTGAVKTFGGASARSGRSASATAVDVNKGVKSLVSLYLLIDTDFKYPIAKVKSDDEGAYEVTAADVKAFLLTPPATGLDADYGYVLPDEASISSSSTDAEIIDAFKALGPLQVRALYVSNGKPKIISAMADPTSTEPVRVDPIVSRVAQQVIGKLVETIKSTINSISFLSADIKKTLLSSVLEAVKTTVTQTLAEVKDVTTFEVPEGVTFDETDPEAMLEVEMDASTIAELESVIASDSTTVTIDDTKVAVADTGKLGDTLSDEEKGSFDKLAEGASSGATDALTAAATGSNASEIAQAAKKVKVDGLRKFFLTLGFPVVLDNTTDNTSVVAISLKVPPSVADEDLPGAATFGDRGIRHFLIKGSNGSSAPANWSNAPVLADQVDALLGDLDGYIEQGIVDETKLQADDQTALLDRVRTFHRFGRALSEGMPMVSTELINWMADYDSKTVTVQDVAVQIAKITEWQQERVVFSEGLPIFTGQYSAPSTGATVKASELVTALTRPLQTDAKSTVPELTDNNENFWAPFAAQALAEQIMRNADQISSSNFEFDTVLPKTKADYKKFLKGVEYTSAGGTSQSVPPSPAYNDARTTVARGLVAALPETAYSTATQKKTLNGETQLSAKASVFIITYLLELQFPIEKAKGLMEEGSDGLLPNIENFKRLNFTQEVGVGEIAAQVMAVTGPEEGEGVAFAQSQMRSGTLLQGQTATAGLDDLLLPEFKTFSAADVGISSKQTTTVECSVSMYDGTSVDHNALTVSLLKFDDNSGEFSAATTNFGSPVGDQYTASNVPTNQGYAIKFKVDSYRNDLPMVPFWADEYSTTINPCGPEGYVISPDVEFQATPGMGLFAGSEKDNAEGVDFSNYTEPGKMFILFPSDEVNGAGARDLMLVGTPGDNKSFTLHAGAEGKLAAVKESNGSFSLSSGTDVMGIPSMLGQSLTSILGTNTGAESFALSPDGYGGLNEQVLLLQVSEKEYWLVELRFVDTEIGMLDLGFAKVSPQGRAEMPEAAFEKGPVDMEKAGDIQHFYLTYGDGLTLNPDAGDFVEFAVGFDGQLADIDDTVSLRYAGDNFLENVESFADLNRYFEDASSIPVRLDGRGSVNFVKLSFDKQQRSYTMSSESSSATALKHNDLVGICLSGNWDGSMCPDYIFRVVRNAPEGDLMANLNLELQGIRFEDPKQGEDPRKAVIGPANSCDRCPALNKSSSDSGADSGGDNNAMIVFDGDYDGVPWLFDPNDEDPNVPGSGSGAAAPGGGDFGFGLAVHLVNKYTYDGGEGGSIKQNNGDDVYSTRLLVETQGVYLGDVEKITLTSEALGMSGATVATCTPPSMNGTLFTEASCEVTKDIASGLTSVPSLVYQSYEGLGLFVAPTSSALTDLNGEEVQYKITFRKPVDFNTNEPLQCGDQECPGMPPAEGKVKIRVPSTPVGGFENVKIGSGDTSAQAQSEVNSIDSGKRIKLSASSVNNASEYELKVFCEGFENSQQMYFEPPFSMSWMLPRGTTTPSFTIEPGMIPSGGGRTCQFRMIAKGEDDLGNPIGATLHKFDLILTGGFSGPGGFVDNALKLSGSQQICLSQDSRPEVAQTCPTTPLVATSVAGNVLAVTKVGAFGLEPGYQVQMLANGELDGDLSVGDECGFIEGDRFSDFNECAIAGNTVLLSFSEGKLSSNKTVKTPDNQTLNQADLDNIAKGGWHELFVETGSVKYRVFLDIYPTGENSKGAFVSLEQETSSDLNALKGGDRFYVQADATQFFEFEVRYAKGTEAKLEFFMPPPRYTLEDGPVELDGVNVGAVSGTTFTPAEGFTFKDAWSQQEVQDIDLSDEGWFEYLASDGETTFRIMLDIQDSGIFYEWFEDFASMGAGPAGGGNLFDGSLFNGQNLCFSSSTFRFFSADACSGDAVAMFSASNNEIALERDWTEVNSTTCGVENFCVIESTTLNARFDISIGKFDGNEVFVSVMPPLDNYAQK